MNETNLIADGFQLMLVGMGMVFIFLSVLVFFTSLLKKLLYSPTSDANTPNTQTISNDEVAAISSAIHSYRQKNLNK